MSQASSANSNRGLSWFRKDFLEGLGNKLKAFYRKKSKLDSFSALWDPPPILTRDEVSNLKLLKQPNLKFWVFNTCCKGVLGRDVGECKWYFSTNSLKGCQKATRMDLALQEELPHTPFTFQPLSAVYNSFFERLHSSRMGWGHLDLSHSIRIFEDWPSYHSFSYYQ